MLRMLLVFIKGINNNNNNSKCLINRISCSKIIFMDDLFFCLKLKKTKLFKFISLNFKFLNKVKFI